jgi:hypothetical protein
MKQVRLTIFDNEPLARLAEQRLQQEGIPCLVRSLQGGPGLWGSAYNLPHGLYVYQSDEMRAREVLDLTPLEIVEREGAEDRAGPRTNLWLVGIIIAILVVLIIAAPSFTRLFG